ncbi:aminopeptidase N-like [Macrosteles quadrilineatus]|uniref:aminopeptidase N-like n=1 Tax=Macrosteles quadrilineatus TaxID=74068 RepID=UPI0023E0C5F4|nr:aminopeptidase N-like [Macrosteles quadrilineatus]
MKVEVEGGEEGKNTTEEEQKYEWWVPISYTSRSEKMFEDAQPKLWFNKETTIPDPAKPEDWLLINLQMAGTYHVRYDQANLKLLKEALNSSREEIPILNRMQLVLDYGLYALSGLEPVPQVLELMDFLADEKHFAPWAAGLRSLWRMDQRLRGTQTGDKLKDRIRRLLSPQLSSLGLRTRKGDTVPVIRHRRQVVRHACLYKLADCVRRAQRLFTKWTDQTDPDKVNPIPPDLRFTVYCTALRTGKEDHLTFLQQRALQSKEPLHRDTMFTALGCFENYEVLYSFMESKLENSTVTRHDFTKLMQGLVQYNENIGPVLQFMERSMVKMKSSTNKKLRWNQTMLRDLSQQIYDVEQLGQFKSLIGASKPWSKSEIAELQRMVEHNASWREKNKNIL